MRVRPSFPMAHLLRLTAALTLVLAPSHGAEPVRSERELRSLYGRYCVGCHGVDGSATAADGRKLKGRDLTTLEHLRGTSDEALASTIRNGLYFGLSMPAYKRELSEAEALAMVRDILRKARKGEAIVGPAAIQESRRAQVASK